MATLILIMEIMQVILLVFILGKIMTIENNQIH